MFLLPTTNHPIGHTAQFLHKMEILDVMHKVFEFFNKRSRHKREKRWGFGITKKLSFFLVSFCLLMKYLIVYPYNLKNVDIPTILSNQYVFYTIKQKLLTYTKITVIKIKKHQIHYTYCQIYLI